MKSINEHIRAHLLASIDLTEVGTKTESLEELRASEWDQEFEDLMRNRLLIGRFRYAAMHDPAKGQYDNINSAIYRLRLYQETGNTEHLVDAANLCMIEKVAGFHPTKHFEAADDGDHHTAKLSD